MELHCPKCEKCIDFTDDMPERACDEYEYKCDCGCKFTYGWYAEPEIKNIISKG